MLSRGKRAVEAAQGITRTPRLSPAQSAKLWCGREEDQDGLEKRFVSQYIASDFSDNDDPFDLKKVDDKIEINDSADGLPKENIVNETADSAHGLPNENEWDMVIESADSAHGLQKENMVNETADGAHGLPNENEWDMVIESADSANGLPKENMVNETDDCASDYIKVMFLDMEVNKGFLKLFPEIQLTKAEEASVIIVPTDKKKMAKATFKLVQALVGRRRAIISHRWVKDSLKTGELKQMLMYKVEGCYSYGPWTPAEKYRPFEYEVRSGPYIDTTEDDVRQLIRAIGGTEVLMPSKDTIIVCSDGDLLTSDDNGHNIGAVYTFMKQLVPDVLSVCESARHIHYWTDSPSSQYRNKTAFYLISAHKDLFGVSATWDYFEAGHGKWPCDGLGGAVKRMADLSVKHGKAAIQDALDFFHWGQTYQKSANYKYVSEAECLLSRTELAEINKGLAPVSGTLLVHSVAFVSVGKVTTNITSCYCDQCLAGNKHDSIAEHNLMKKHGKANKENGKESNVKTSGNHDEKEDDNTVNTEIDTEMRSDNLKTDKYQVEEWVSVKIDKDWFIGKILEIDYEDGDCRVTFMRQTKCKDTPTETFKWPVPVDELWVKFESIICKIDPPCAVGRSGRSYTISQYTIDKIMSSFNSLPPFDDF